MARSCNKPLSEWFGIDDPEIAFAFEIECSEILNEWDMEQQARMFETLGTAQIQNAITGTLTPKGFDTSKANYH